MPDHTAQAAQNNSELGSSYAIDHYDTLPLTPQRITTQPRSLGNDENLSLPNPKSPGDDHDSSLKEPDLSQSPPPPSTLLARIHTHFKSFEATLSARMRPLFHSFEEPKWKPIGIHVLFCILAYPILMIFVVIAHERSLFWARFIIAVGCGLVGLGISCNFLELGKPFIEAATWATMVHLSQSPDDKGVKLGDLAAASANATSSFSALKLLWARARQFETRSARKTYDQRFWTTYVMFFLLLMVIAATISFTLGRLIFITATLTHQTLNYEEVTISGVNSPDDLARIVDLKDAFFDDVFHIMWTPLTFLHHDRLPLVASLNFSNDKVYFSETTLSQLLPGGHGFGNFDNTIYNPSTSVEETTTTTITRDASKPIDPGSMLRYPKWGTRIHCVKLPDPETNLIPNITDGSTVIFTPRQAVRDLFTYFSLTLNESALVGLKPEDIKRLNSSLPTRLNRSEVASASFISDNNISVFPDIYQYEADTGRGEGWIMIETVLLRLNTMYAPGGKFARISNASVPDATGAPTQIGYDSIVCLELFEPWIVETYNGTTGTPSTQRVIGPGSAVQDGGESNMSGHRHELPVTDPTAARNITSTNLTDVFLTIYQNTLSIVNNEANSVGLSYGPTQTLNSFTDGTGPLGYTEASADRYAQYRGSMLAMNLLPYFAGSGQLVTQRYPDRVIASAYMEPAPMLGYLAGMLVVGLIAGFFVPKLPCNFRRRGFQLYAWLAMFHANELDVEHPDTGTVSRNMKLEDIEQEFGELRFRYNTSSATQRGGDA